MYMQDWACFSPDSRLLQQALYVRVVTRHSISRQPLLPASAARWIHHLPTAAFSDCRKEAPLRQVIGRSTAV